MKRYGLLDRMLERNAAQRIRNLKRRWSMGWFVSVQSVGRRRG